MVRLLGFLQIILGRLFPGGCVPQKNCLQAALLQKISDGSVDFLHASETVSYTHLRAHETEADL
eukprot:1421262-Rhodomonas_salina.3